MSGIRHWALKSDTSDTPDTPATSDTSDILDILDHWVVRYLRHFRKFQPLPATSRQTSHFRLFVKLLMLYLVRWAGYEGTDEETSWLLATELGNASELVENFHAKYPGKPGPLDNM